MIEDQREILSICVAQYIVRQWRVHNPSSKPTVEQMGKYIARGFALGQLAHSATSMQQIEDTLRTKIEQEANYNES